MQVLTLPIKVLPLTHNSSAQQKPKPLKPKQYETQEITNSTNP
jgi:hypothetical protein